MSNGGPRPEFFICQHRVWIRDTPSTSGERLGVLTNDEIVGVAGVGVGLDGEKWARLAEEECNYLLMPNQKGPRTAWVLIDGASLGLPVLLAPLPPSP